MNANTLALDIVRNSTRITRDELEAEMEQHVLPATVSPAVRTLIARGHLVERDDGVLELGDEEAIEAAAREREQRKAAPVEPVAKSHREDPSMRQYPAATPEQFAEMSTAAKVLYLLAHNGPMTSAQMLEQIPVKHSQQLYSRLGELKNSGKIRKAGKAYELANGLPPGPSLDIEPTAPIVDVQAACAEAEELSRPGKFDGPQPDPAVFNAMPRTLSQPQPLPPKPERVRTIGDLVEKHTCAPETVSDVFSIPSAILGDPKYADAREIVRAAARSVQSPFAMPHPSAQATVGSVTVRIDGGTPEQAARMLAAALGALA